MLKYFFFNMYLKVIYEGQCFNFEPRQDKKETTLGSDISRKVQHHAIGTMTSQASKHSHFNIDLWKLLWSDYASERLNERSRYLVLEEDSPQ